MGYTRLQLVNLTSSTVNLFFIEHETSFESVSKEGQSMILTQQNNYARASILKCFWAREPP
jgi:hypothetical protein